MPMVIKNLSPDGGSFAISFAWLLAMLMWTAPLSPWAAAQPAAAPEAKYDEMLVDTNLKRNTAKVNQMLSEGKFDAGGQQMFDDFYQQFLLPQWTHDLTNLPKFRHDLANQPPQEKRRRPHDRPRPPERAVVGVHAETGGRQLSSGHPCQCDADDRGTESRRATADTSA